MVAGLAGLRAFTVVLIIASLIYAAMCECAKKEADKLKGVVDLVMIFKEKM